MRDKLSTIIDLLLDENARADGRDDAAMELGEFADARAIQPLLSVATNLNSDIVLAETAAESLAEVWVGLGYYDKHAVKRMPNYSQNEIIGIFSVRKPEWHKELVAFLDWKHDPGSIE